MQIDRLRRVLERFIDNPGTGWGAGTDGNGGPFDTMGCKTRVTPEQADFNTARLNSGSYRPAQLQDFNDQLRVVEQCGCGTAYFAGSPYELPDEIPERLCSCGKMFRSVKTEEDVVCYDCNINRLCPVLPGRHLRGWWKRELWTLQMFGDVGFHNEMTYWWYNQNSAGNVCHQGLVVKRDVNGKIRSMRLSTIASLSRTCYIISFNYEAGPDDKPFTVSALKSTTVNNGGYGKVIDTEQPDPLMLDFVAAKLPSWMLDAYREKATPF